MSRHSHYVPAQGRSGGILLLIRENVFRYNYLGGNKQVLAIEIEGDDQHKWILGGVYASTKDSIREDLWGK